jgi:shikimate kinase
VKPRNIVLTGFMGTGKSTVGRLVAGRLGWRFVDADAEIVRAAGMSIPAIFAEHDEPYFRRLETDICRQLAERPQVVIATGGGMLVDEANRMAMQRTGLVVCLNADVKALERRLRGDPNRPLLKTDWRALLERRRPAYAAIPFQVDTADKAPEDVALEIIRLWRNHSASG